jgi:hypothetical protein
VRILSRTQRWDATTATNSLRSFLVDFSVLALRGRRE